MPHKVLRRAWRPQVLGSYACLPLLQLSSLPLLQEGSPGTHSLRRGLPPSSPAHALPWNVPVHRRITSLGGLVRQHAFGFGSMPPRTHTSTQCTPLHEQLFDSMLLASSGCCHGWRSRAEGFTCTWSEHLAHAARSPGPWGGHQEAQLLHTPQAVSQPRTWPKHRPVVGEASPLGQLRLCDGQLLLQRLGVLVHVLQRLLQLPRLTVLACDAHACTRHLWPCAWCWLPRPAAPACGKCVPTQQRPCMWCQLPRPAARACSSRAVGRFG